MKYLIIDNKTRGVNKYVYDIADFFWNNGNEIYLSTNFTDQGEYQNIIKYCDCLVIVNERSWEESALQKYQFHKQTNFGQSVNEKWALTFLNNGVYFNALPFPHKIFHYTTLSRRELKAFFRWCNDLSLFKV